ncbi:2'-5' RNA ligase superfamily [Anaerolinea thermolimosa]|uniref:2'-5' RNA ligase family protein n=1 Tax=Anaerolinea thermolimosa TaxID=229919 RepID=UPI00078257CE|nr:2'-5' RNA ligase family protein [Anaerolinea thermolimosa]GAP06360.1 2'-5' RNA ligase superfamily [Anaerolinea thermolimosa]
MTRVLTVASIVDTVGTQTNAVLWEVIGRIFHEAEAPLTILPHLSWHVAAHYDQDLLDEYLRRLAGKIGPIPLKVVGVGVFSGKSPVIYLTVTKTPGIARLHHLLWTELGAISSEVNPNYDPVIWIPHVSLNFGEVNREVICKVVAEMAYLSMDFQLVATNIAVLYKDPSGSGVFNQYSLEGGEMGI